MYHGWVADIRFGLYVLGLSSMYQGWVACIRVRLHVSGFESECVWRRSHVSGLG